MHTRTMRTQTKPEIMYEKRSQGFQFAETLRDQSIRNQFVLKKHKCWNRIARVREVDAAKGGQGGRASRRGDGGVAAGGRRRRREERRGGRGSGWRAGGGEGSTRK